MKKFLAVIFALLFCSEALAVNPLRTPTISANNAISNAVAHTDQFRELFYQAKTWMVASGGTVLLSNGGGTAGAADNIPNAAAVTMGAAGTGAWVVIQFAAATVSSSAHRVLLYVDDAADPRQVIGMRAGPGSWSGGNTTTLPTLAGVATAADTTNLHPFATARNLRWSSWRTTTPNRPQKFIVKEEGVAAVHMLLTLVSNENASGGGSGNERWAWFMNDNGTDTITSAIINNSTFWSGLDAAGGAEVGTEAHASIWSIASTWTNGLDGFGNAHPQPILVGQTVAAGRTIGTMVDHYAIPANFGFGLRVDASENAQAFQRYCFGDVVFYWPAGTTVQ